MTGEPAERPLAGLRVLVTRPAAQTRGLCDLIERAGGSACALPVIQIDEPEDEAVLAQTLARLDRFDIAVFISANAVDKACERLAGRWPPRLRTAAVGRASAAALRAHGLPVDICPDRDFSSEGLLAREELRQVAGRRILIFRGAGGRELLAESLRARGAVVEYAEVYRRALPPGAAQELRRIAAAGNLDLVVVTSSEGLRNLHELAGAEARAWLLARPLIVIGERTAQLAAELGFERPAWPAAEASDAGLMEAILRWRRSAGNRLQDRHHAQ